MHVLSINDIEDQEIKNVFLNKFEYDGDYDDHTRIILNKAVEGDGQRDQKSGRSTPSDPESNNPVPKREYPSITDPIVSSYFINKYGAPSYYEDHPFVLNLTHDVDDINPPSTHFFLSLLRFYKNIGAVGDFLGWKLGFSKSPYKNLRLISGIEEKYGAKSTFFLLPTETDFRRKRYKLEEISDDVNYLLDKGFEVGLHTSYYSFNNEEAIRGEKTLLEKTFNISVKGCRNHYLRFKVPETWSVLESAGLEYDTTYGLENDIGFRNGVCHPFYPYNYVDKTQIGILELPLNIMDTALFKGMDIDYEGVWGKVQRIIDTVEKNGGVLTILFHNSWFSSFMGRDITRLYEKILGYCSDRNAWITNSSSLVNWVKKANNG